MGSAYEEDLERLATDDLIPWGDIDGRIVMVSGATGLVGGAVVDAILMRNDIANARTRLICPVRSVERARERFGDRPDVVISMWDACDATTVLSTACDIIVHCASITQSRLFVESPIEVIDTTVEGTRSMLKAAEASGAAMVYVSSMEVYGDLSSDVPIREDVSGPLDAMNVRSCYPQAKQLAETLCAAYARESGVKVCVARLAQSFGAGTPPTDTRVFSQIAHACIDGRDIELATDGTKANMYTALPDTVTALLTLCVRSDSGTAYNVANADTFCTVRRMAELASKVLTGGKSKVRVGTDSSAAGKYPVSTQMPLDTTRIQLLGWRPTQGLSEMYLRMVADWRMEK